MMKLKSLIEKSFIVIKKNTFLKRFLIDENMYYSGEKNSKYEKILMYFPNPEFMHLGDHFFFEPLANVLQKNFNFKIMPTKVMEFYFRENGYKIANDSDIEKADLIITRIDFLNDKKLKNRNVLFIDAAYPKINRPLCEDIVYKVLKFLKFTLSNSAKRRTSFAGYDRVNLKPSKIKTNQNILKKFKLNSKDKFVLFNNYLDTGNYLTSIKQFERLENFARNMSKKINLQVIHIGTMQEKTKDKKIYDFVSVDLRGKTIPEDIFHLAAHENIKYNISFDAFQMHVFCIYGKKSYILFRGRIGKNATRFIFNSINPCFKPDVPVKELIEYIN